jgi:hypothetical protein
MENINIPRAILTFSIILGSAVPAFAEDEATLPLSRSEFEVRAHRAEELAARVKRIATYSKKLHDLSLRRGTFVPRGPVVNVPELGRDAMGGALVLLIGGALVLRDGRRRVSPSLLPSHA